MQVVDPNLEVEIMIKIIFFVDIAFLYRKANIRHMWSNILRRFYWNKGLCHCHRSS